MLERYRRWVDRKNQETLRDQHKSDPQFHGPIGMRLAAFVGGPVYWIVTIFLRPLWWLLFVAVGLALLSPQTLELAWSWVAEVTGWSPTMPDYFDWFWAFFVVGIISVVVGYVREQRDRLVAEGRLKSEP